MISLRKSLNNSSTNNRSRQSIFLRFAVTLVYLLMIVTIAQSQTRKTFHLISLPRSVSVEVPDGWRVLSAADVTAVGRLVDAFLDFSEIALPHSSRVNLIAANSTYYRPYASVRIDVSSPPPSLPDEVSRLTRSEIAQLNQLMRHIVEHLLVSSGQKMLQFHGTRVDQVSGHPAIVTEYVRSGPAGPVFVQLNQVITEYQEVSVNLSYEESAARELRPVFEAIRGSIRIGDWR